MPKIKSVTVYCGSRNGTDSEYLVIARRFGSEVARRGMRVVYGGANVGLMGAVADGALESGGRVFGVIPKNLMEKEVAHRGITELCVVADMHERKALMMQEGDAYVALPGGGGTLEEWFEVFTWAQIGLHRKPVGLLNAKRFYDPLLRLVDHIADTGFAAKEHQQLFVTAPSATELLDALENFVPPPFGNPKLDLRAPRNT